MKQRPQYLLEALVHAGHPLFFVDPRLSENTIDSGGVSQVKSLAPVPDRGVILYTHFAPTSPLIDRFEEAVVIYDILDDLSIYDADEVDLPPKLRVQHHHPTMMEVADVVITSNRVLLGRHSAERNDVLLVENGVDLDLFHPPRPSPARSQHVIGYHGAVASWFDFDLVGALALARPELTVKIVGPVDDRVASAASQLERLENVEFIPQMPVARVAEVVRSFDVGLIPFVIDEMTQGVTPLKMYEYLASGVPVLATAIPACVEEPNVTVINDIGQLPDLADAALEIGPEERSALRTASLDASWERRIEPLLDRLDELQLRSTP
ncbi:MAG: glycosyltransferase [Acidimicrobiia bacterium]